MIAGLHPSPAKGTPERRLIRARAMELLKTHDKREVVQILRQETGLSIAIQAVHNWESAHRNPGRGRRGEEITLTPEQEGAVLDDRAAVQAELAKLAHRCGTCRGVSHGTRCEWCGERF